MSPHTSADLGEESSFDPAEEDDFRRGLEELLVRARENGLEVSNQSWTCVSDTTERTWDVEITTVAPGRDSD